MELQRLAELAVRETGDAQDKYVLVIGWQRLKRPRSDKILHEDENISGLIEIEMQ